MVLYVAICWLGAAIGTSPHRNIGTVFLAPLFVFLAHFSYGQGVQKAWKEIRRTGGAAGVGRKLTTETELSENRVNTRRYQSNLLQYLN